MSVAQLPHAFSKLALGLLLCGCHSYAPAESPRQGVARAGSGPIEVTRTDHSVVRMRDASVARDSIVGTANDGSYARVAIALNDVAGVATEHVDAGRSVALGGGVILGTFGVLLLALLVVASTTNW